ncbi:uncharacterized protein [Arachis hypogaea]|uniref:uncharacterized protein n=1 Tax=Arachis hypogaea TaxID=3818 RepID=UPI000DEDBCDC|nr:uncharacterized protein LOC112786400 [Arachis hypogaea]
MVAITPCATSFVAPPSLISLPCFISAAVTITSKLHGLGFGEIGLVVGFWTLPLWSHCQRRRRLCHRDSNHWNGSVAARTTVKASAIWFSHYTFVTFDGLPAQDPIRHLKDFQGVCSTTRREGFDEVAIWLFAFPFSLEGRAKEWFYTLPSEVVFDWDLLRREFLDKFLPVEVTDKLRKEISCLVQGEMETLYEYWERFRKLLDSCPNHMIDTQVLLSYVCQGMRPQDKTLLDASSNGSLSKYRTAEEAWQLITDLAESTQHARRRTNHPKTVNEVSSSSETAALAKSLGEMTSLLKQLQLGQQRPQLQHQPPPPPQQQSQQLVPQRVCGWRDNFNQGWRDNYQQGGRDNGGNQRWNNNNSQNRYSQNQPYPQQNQGRNYQTYQPPHQRQPPQPNQLQAPQIIYPSTSSNQDDTLHSILQGQKELQTTLVSGLTGLTSTLQDLLARMEPSSTPQTSSSSAIPSQPLPNPNGGINAITLRSRTKLQERRPKKPSPIIVTQDEDEVEIEEVVEENEAQEVVEDEVSQPRSEVSKDEKVLEEVAQPILFPTLARKAKKRVELDPKMVEMFKKVEVTIPLFDAIHQVPKYAKFLKDLCMNKDRIHELETIPLGSSISALMGALPKKCGDPGPCMVTCTIDGVQFIDCMCDLGACVSIMPLSVYHILKLPPLKRSAAMFVLADKSIITVTGIVENVLVNIKDLVFPIDFHILEMPPSESEKTSSILLGRPFLRTSRFKLDVYSGT